MNRRGMKIHVHKVLILAALAMMLEACTVSTTEVAGPSEFPPDAIERHVSNYKDVLNAFGPPAKLSAIPEGFIFLYEGVRSREKKIAISIKSFSLGFARGDGEFSATVFIFDPKGTLIGAAQDHREQDLGLSFAIGVKSASAINQDVYLVPATQHRWGMSMLRQLPRTLNAANDLDSGIAGLEQTATPSIVGQRTLESASISGINLGELVRKGLSK